MGYSGLIQEVAAADHPRGFYEEPFSLTLTTEMEAATIRYTKNGTVPTESVAEEGGNGTVYTEPISIYTTTILRVGVFKPDFIPSRIVTYTYLFLADVVNQPANPAGFPDRWKVVEASYEMNPDYPESDETIIKALTALPTISVVADPDDIFGSRGFYPNGETNRNDPWEKPCSIEMIYPDGRVGFQENVGVQGRNSAPGEQRKRGIRIDFKSRYGPSKLEFPIFEDAVEGADTAARRFDSLNLRSGKTENYTGVRYEPDLVILFRDPMLRNAELAMRALGTRNIHVHLYLNGLYWGVFNLTEAHEPDYYSTYLGGRDSDWFQVKAKDRSDFDGNDGLFARTDTEAVDRYLAFLDFMVAADLSQSENYRRVLHDIDPVDFADYIIYYNFYAVGDWPDNNWTFVMKNGDQPLPGRFLA